MVSRDEENVSRRRRPSADERRRPEPTDSSDSGEDPRREDPGFRPVTRVGGAPAPGVPSPFFRVPNGSSPRRGPSYPAWEKPPSPYDYPRLRGREAPKTNWAPLALIVTAIGVGLILFAVVVLRPLLGHGGSAAVASPSASAVATQSVGPALSPGVSPSTPGSGNGGTAGPQISFQQYKVVAGDTTSKIAKKYGLKAWELLLANPDLAANPSILRIGLTLNIPQPGQLTPPPPAPTASLGPS
jgi:LysM repeat protein